MRVLSVLTGIFFALTCICLAGTAMAQQSPSFVRRPSGDDVRYPSRAQREGIEGRTRVELTIGDSGRVVSCTPTTALGGGLEEEHCRVMTLRARFDGPGNYSSDLIWNLPEGSPPPSPGTGGAVYATAGTTSSDNILFECDFGGLILSDRMMIGPGSMRSYVGEWGSNSEWGYNSCTEPAECRLTPDEFYIRTTAGSTFEGRIDRRSGQGWERIITQGRVGQMNSGFCSESAGQALPPAPELRTFVGSPQQDMTPRPERDYASGSGYRPRSDGYDTSGASAGSGYAYCTDYRSAPGTEPTTYFSEIFVQPSHGYTGLLASEFTAHVSEHYDDRAYSGSGASCNSYLPSHQAAEDAMASDASGARSNGRRVIFTGWWP